MLQRDDEVLLSDMLDAGREAVGAAQGRILSDLQKDAVLRAALERFLMIIGEAENRLSDQVRDEIPDVPWNEVIGMRNRLVHGYFAINPQLVWDTVVQDLPILISAVEGYLDG